MSAEAAPAPRPQAFSPAAVLALVIVGVVAFAGLAVLSAYAPELRGRSDVRAHALSRSAVGYAGAVVLMRALEAPVVVSRTRAPHDEESVVVLTPGPMTSAEDLEGFATDRPTLIVLPKWQAQSDPVRPRTVRKLGVFPPGPRHEAMLKAFAPKTAIAHRKGVSGPVLHGAGGPFAEGTYLPLAPVDRLQTISGDGWAPALVDETGAMVLAYARKAPHVWLLAEPDLLNNQGIARLENARAAAAILNAGRRGGAVVFDVTLAGFERERGLGRLLLTPPWLAATLCGVAAALLMGLHALARFGHPRRAERAFALGSGALVDNTAGLVRLARKEHELAPAYAALVRSRIAKAAGGHAEEGWLEELARRRGAASPAELAAEAGRAKSRDDLLAVARKLFKWKSEMTREGG